MKGEDEVPWIHHAQIRPSYNSSFLSHEKIASAPFSQEQSNIKSWATPSMQIGETP